jgi:type I restriction enzyme, S subunit
MEQERIENEYYFDDKFGRVPIGWEIKRLKKVTNCLDSKRKPIKGEDRKNIAGDYRYYGAAGIIDYVNDYIFDGRYILFGEDGENLISRKVAQAFIVEGKFWVNNHAHILETIEGVSDMDFVCYQLESKNYENIIYGSAQPKINKADLNKIKLLIPKNLQEQTAIASILSKVDEAIEAAQNSIKAAEKLKISLMQNLLTGKLKPDGTWRNDNEFYVDEKFGKVPKGWEVKRVKDCFDFFPTASYSRSQLIEKGKFQYIHYGDIHTKFDRILDVTQNTLPFIPDELRKKFELLRDGDLVISDASEDWAGVGKCIELVNVGEKKIISGLHTLHLRPKSIDFIQGIKGYVLNIYQVATSIKRLATGMKVYGISKPNLGRILLPVPTIPEQKLIKDKLDFCSNDILHKQTKIQTLQRLKKSLMQNLLTGKVRLDVEKINKILSEQ